MNESSIRLLNGARKVLIDQRAHLSPNYLIISRSQGSLSEFLINL